MKKIIIPCIVLISVMLSGCESYLDRQPDEALTSKDIFKKKETTFQYLITVYSLQPQESDVAGQSIPWTGASDECSVAFPNASPSRDFISMNQCTWQPASNTSRTITYDRYYRGIREASYYIQHAFDCPELSNTEAVEWCAEARMLRAYYYFCLMRQYGPIFLLGETPADITDAAISKKERNTWDECVKYVTDQLDLAAADLPLTQPDNFYGRVTKGAALAIKARLLLYSARPLFNGNRLYAGIVSKNGTNLFPTAPDLNKWALAAQAAKDVIDLNVYHLVGENDPSNPYANYKNVFIKRNNSELIFTNEESAYKIRVVCIPRAGAPTAYGGMGVTQKLVDAYAMSNGKYPITGYTNDGLTPIIDAESGYSETGFSAFTHPVQNRNYSNVFKMYQDREPRFYITVFWSGMTWPKGSAAPKTDIQFYTGGNSGPGSTHNYCTTGCLFDKFNDPSLALTDGAGKSYGVVSWPLCRYAEVLLNYVEALNESDPGNADILTYLNKVRNRSGVPNIEDVYPSAVNDQIQMCELIRRERFIELALENHRYFDTRTWMIAETENNGPVYGMNVEATDHNPGGAFWKRVKVSREAGVSGPRIFQKKCYLFPLPQSEIDRDKYFTQNYGW